MLLISVVVVGSLAVGATPAMAACVGSDNTAVVCVNPTGGTLYEDCVYLGGEECQQVTVPGPTVSVGCNDWKFCGGQP